MDVSMSSPSSSGQSNNNVVIFPKKNARILPPEENEAIREATQRAYVDEVTEAYAAHIANKLAQQGFDVFNNEFDRHFGFTIEALRSTLLMTLGLHHPFQEVVVSTVRTLSDVDEDEFDPA
jgi:hypothetical protein